MASNTNINRDALRFAGDINVDRVMLVSASNVAVDVTAMVTEIQIFEDIFQFYTSGTLAIRDSIDLPNIFPFVGEERLKLVLKTPGLSDSTENRISKEFYVYKLSDRTIMSNRNVFYMLHFCSLEKVINSNVKLSKTYSGKISEIVAKLVRSEGLQSGTTVTIDETANSVKYTSNYWSPYKNIDYLLQRAMGTTRSANYLFFENRSGLNFLSLDTLFSQQPILEYTYDNFSRDNTPTDGTLMNTGKEFSRLSELKIERAYDYLQRLQNGAYASKMISYDITTKKYSTKNYTMFDNYAGEVHLNKYPIATTDIAVRINSNIFNYPKYNSNFNAFGDDGAQKWLQNRISLMSQLTNSFKVTAEAAGRTDMTVGKTVYLKLYKNTPTTQESTSEEILDTLFSGKYIVSAINHRITQGRHYMHMEFLKESILVNPMSGKK